MPANFDPEIINDLILGCAFQEAETGTNVARNIGLLAGLPESVPGQTVNRFCSSGLQAISMAANAIKVGEADCIMAGGVETMSMVPMGGNLNVPNVELGCNVNQRAMTAMGNTAENLAVKYNISREEQDAFALDSHRKAIRAQDEHRFDEQIIPVDAVKYRMNHETGHVEKYKVPFTVDEGVRRGLTPEKMASLKTVFKKGGTVTAGNASQMNDAAAIVILMSADKAKELGIKFIKLLQDRGRGNVIRIGKPCPRLAPRDQIGLRNRLDRFDAPAQIVPIFGNTRGARQLRGHAHNGDVGLFNVVQVEGHDDPSSTVIIPQGVK